jgi:hypothetical protein
MKKNWFGIFALICAVGVLAGCPNPAQDEGEQKFTVSGYIDDPDNFIDDMTLVEVQLLRHGAKVGTAIPAQEDGGFSFRSVAKGADYSVKAALVGFEPAQTAPFSVSGPVTGITLELTRAIFDITGTITTENNSGDLTAAKVQLLWLGTNKGAAVHPNANGAFTISTEYCGEADYKLEITLSGFDSLTTANFALTGPKQFGTLPLPLMPPVVVSAEMAVNNVITLTFDKAVDIPAGSVAAFSTHFTNLTPTAPYLITSAAPVDSNDKTVWELTMNQALLGYEVMQLRYDATTGAVKQSDENRFVKSFSVSVEKNFTTGLEIMQAEVAQSMRNVISILFNDVPQNASKNGFSVSSTGGAVNIINFLPMQSICIIVLNRPITAGETLTLSYDNTVGSMADSNGNPMASFTDMVVTIL